MGRPLKLTKPVLEAICENLELGMPLSLAAEAEGVARTTILTHMEEDEAVKRQVTRARATGAKVLTKLAVDGNGGKGSSMAGWLLERRYRDDYAPPKKEDVQPAEVNITIVGGLPPRPKGDVSPP